MLRHAAEVWDASDFLSGQILDIGCGLGGGSIFWAEEFGAQVTAVTCVPSHAAHVARFAAEAGVEQQIEAACLRRDRTPRRKPLRRRRRCGQLRISSADWLDRMASLLWPGGSLFIIDCFLEDPKYADLFNSHWHTRIGTIPYSKIYSGPRHWA